MPSSQTVTYFPGSKEWHAGKLYEKPEFGALAINGLNSHGQPDQMITDPALLQAGKQLKAGNGRNCKQRYYRATFVRSPPSSDRRKSRNLF